MKKFQFFWLLSFIYTLVSFAYAQAPAPVTLPAVVPPPGDAATLGKYGDVPVTMSNGLPSISVPVFDIKTPRLSLPISMNYYAGGIKVDDIASWVGLGWSLNAGGVITRSIRGLDDFLGKGYYNSTVPHAASAGPTTDWRFFEDVTNHTQDADPDYFFYNFGPYSGKFVFNESKVPMILNYQDPLQIQYSASGFTVTDGQGNNYYFFSTEMAKSGDHRIGNMGSFYTSSWYLSQIISNDKSDTISFSYIVDAETEQDSYSFVESIGPSYDILPPSGSAPCDFSYQGVSQDPRGSLAGNPFTQSYPLRLNEIDFKNGKIQFYTSSRLDNGSVKMDSLVVSNYNFNTGTFAKIKKIIPFYGYFPTSLPNKPATAPSNFRLRLDSVSTFGSDNIFGGTYRFTYDGTMLPYITSNAKDLFGYYNGKYANVSLIATQAVTFNGAAYTVGNGDRSTNTDSIQAGILKKIVYPTGGSTQFVYEPNSYQSNFSDQYELVTATGSTHQVDSITFTPLPTTSGTLTVSFTGYNYADVHTRPYVVIKNVTTGQISTYIGINAINGSLSVIAYNMHSGQTYRLIAYAFDDNKVVAKASMEWQQYDGHTVFGGGLRIKQITDYDYNGRFAKSELYKYGDGESGFGFLPSSSTLLNTNFTPRKFQYNCPTESYPCLGGATPAVLRETFTGSSIYDIFSLAGSPVSYKEVAKYQLDSLGNNLGKSVFDFTVYQNSTIPGSAPYTEAYCIVNSGWAGSQPFSEKDYAWKNGRFWPVKTVSTSYTTNHAQQGRGLKIGITEQFTNGILPPLDSIGIALCFYQLYYFFDYPIYSGTIQPYIQTTIDYDMNDTTLFVVHTKQLGYDTAAKHLQPTSVVENRSDTSLYTTLNYYPEEVSSLTGLSGPETTTINTMISQHNLTPVLQSNRFLGGATPLSVVKHHYNTYNTTMTLPSATDIQNGAFSIENRLQFQNYDTKGNLSQVAKANDVSVSYVWDYHNAEPIAEVKNAAVADIAFSSFEGDGSGNWTIGSATRNHTTGITGSSCYGLSSGNISKTGLTSTNTYIVSYWTTNASAYTITGTVAGYPIKGKTISMNGSSWTYFEHKLTGQTSVTLSGTGNIDELRLYPASAQMTTYSYNPLVGMTNSCDAGNKISYYFYDGLSRLKWIKDQDGNIIKTIQYHYMTGSYPF